MAGGKVGHSWKHVGVIAIVVVLGVAGYYSVQLLQPTANVIDIEPFQPDEWEGFKSYVGNDFYLYYPDDWKPRKIINEFATVEIGFVSPGQEGDEFTESIIITSDVLGSYSMRDYATVSLLRLQNEVIPGFSLEDTGQRVVNGIEGFETVFTGNDSINPIIKYKQVYLPIDNRIYIITYTARESAYDSSIADAESVIESFSQIRT